MDSTVLRDSILRIALSVADHGISGSGRFQSARELLLRERPSVLRGTVGTLIGAVSGYCIEVVAEIVALRYLKIFAKFD